MNNTFINLLFNKLTKSWGSSKLMKVLSLAAFGASSFAFAGAAFIPDEPDEDTEAVEKSTAKPNKNKSIKKENV